MVTTQAKQGIWLSIFSDNEITGNLDKAWKMNGLIVLMVNSGGHLKNKICSLKDKKICNIGKRQGISHEIECGHP